MDKTILNNNICFFGK